MEEKILEFIKSTNTVYNVKSLYKEFGSKDLVRNVLDNLEQNGDIVITANGKVLDFLKSGLKKGKFIANKKGYGFVEFDKEEEDIYIPKESVLNAIDGDIVVIEVAKVNKGEKPYGRIFKVIKRNKDYLVGEIVIENDKYYVLPDNDIYKFKVLIPKEETNSLVEGMKVLVKVIDNKNSNIYHGSIEKVIGHKDDPLIDVLAVAYDNGFYLEDSIEVKKQLEQIPSIVTEKEIVNRKDLREEEIFTIDGSDTKDIDDAISIKKEANGNYILGVHIADVTYYFKENSPLDNSAYDKATSVYLTNYVLPMLPHQLSNGICSLNEGVDRLTITCEVKFDNNANIIDYDIYESVINSKKKMTYESVNRLLEENIVDEGYEDYVSSLKLMNELSSKIRKNKVKRGYIEFLSDEIKIIVDEYGIPIDIHQKEQKTGEKLIEDFMIVANESVATRIKDMGLPNIYRIHEKPKIEKIKEFLGYVTSLGYKLTGDFSKLEPKDIQNMLEQLKDKKEFAILSDMLLRCMQKAIYSNENIGHFGLASPCYTHFTSPIRRYPDEIVHRLLRKYLFKHDYSNESMDNLESKIAMQAEHSSIMERKAVECEREVNDMKMAEYMESHIGEEFDGTIVGVKNFGMFVKLTNLVEGAVSIRDLGNYFTYDEKGHTLRGGNKIYKLGDSVRIRVKAASKDARRIDFEIVNNKEKYGNKK
jgi:ribonuclease R